MTNLMDSGGGGLHKVQPDVILIVLRPEQLAGVQVKSHALPVITGTLSRIRDEGCGGIRQVHLIKITIFVKTVSFPCAVDG